MDFSKMQIAEKVYYRVTIERKDWRDQSVEVELLTGDYNNSAIEEIISLLDNVDYPNPDNHDTIAKSIWCFIRHDKPMPDYDGIAIESVENEAYFSHNGCDIRNDKLGASVYDCIAYKDAKDVDKGEYWDIQVSGEALYNYHYGE